jgi:hypothetical protein
MLMHESIVQSVWSNVCLEHYHPRSDKLGLGTIVDQGLHQFPQTVIGQFLSPQEIAKGNVAHIFQMVNQIGTGII